MAVSRSLPVGNKNFVGTSIVSSRNTLYKDIDLSFETKPGVTLVDSDGNSVGTLSGDVYKKVDVSAVTQSLKTLLLTNRFEKPFQPNFGANLQSLLFDNIETYTQGDISEIIKGMIERYEPRALLKGVHVDLGPFAINDSNINTIAITVVFAIGNSQENFSFKTTLNRLR